MRDSKYLLPDNNETVRATELLAREGFVVLPYMYPDLYAARALADAGAAAVMPLAAPIGSNKGLATRDFIQILIDEIDLPVIVDAGIGRPSQACEAMEMGGGGHYGQHRPGHRPGTCPSWPPPSARPSRQAGRPICPAPAGAQPRGRPVRSPHRLSSD